MIKLALNAISRIVILAPLPRKIVKHVQLVIYWPMIKLALHAISPIVQPVQQQQKFVKLAIPDII